MIKIDGENGSITKVCIMQFDVKYIDNGFFIPHYL